MAPEIILELILIAISMFLAQAFNAYWALLLPIFGLLFFFSSFFAFYWAPYVPSNNSKLKTMLEISKIKKGERVYDLGAGDGKIIDGAAKLGAKATGFEISIPLVLYYYFKRMVGISKAEMLWGNFFKKNISDADVVFCYLFPHTMNKFHKTIYKQLKPGTRVISNAFEITSLVPVKKMNEVYLYIVK